MCLRRDNDTRVRHALDVYLDCPGRNSTSVLELRIEALCADRSFEDAIGQHQASKRLRGERAVGNTDRDHGFSAFPSTSTLAPPITRPSDDCVTRSKAAPLSSSPTTVSPVRALPASFTSA